MRLQFQSVGKRVIPRHENAAIRGARRDRQVVKSHVLLLREADTRLGSELWLMEHTIEVAVFFVVPADVLQMHKAPAFDFFSHFLKAGKRTAGGGSSWLESPLDG